MNLDDVQVGDNVLFFAGLSYKYDVRLVIRVTKTQIIIGTQEFPIKFRKSNGRRVGKKYDGGIYSHSYISAVTPEECEAHLKRIEEEQELETLHRTVRNYIKNIEPNQMSKEEAEELICFLKNEWKQGI